MSNSSLDTDPTINLADVKAAVIDTLGIEDRADALDAETSLASIPELDSMAVIELVVELERRFGFTVEDDDITAEVFDTVGSLAAFVDSKLR
jgi:acyl carrier protein